MNGGSKIFPIEYLIRFEVETYLRVFVNSPYQFETTRYLFMCFCYQFELGKQEKDGFLFRIQKRQTSFLLMMNII